MIRVNLVPHPATPPATVDQILVDVAMGPSGLWLEYQVLPAGRLLLPQMTAGERRDGLWQTTCCELFVQPVGGSDYFEFNFSPSSDWAAYQFSGYRADMRDLPAEDPEIWITPGDPFFLAVEAMPDLPRTALRIGVTAVIEETDGTKSYWALAHPSPEPDFHNAAGFLLEFPER